MYSTSITVTIDHALYYMLLAYPPLRSFRQHNYFCEVFCECISRLFCSVHYFVDFDDAAF